MSVLAKKKARRERMPGKANGVVTSLGAKIASTVSKNRLARMHTHAAREIFPASFSPKTFARCLLTDRTTSQILCTCSRDAYRGRPSRSGWKSIPNSDRERHRNMHNVLRVISFGRIISLLPPPKCTARTTFDKNRIRLLYDTRTEPTDRAPYANLAPTNEGIGTEDAPDVPRRDGVVDSTETYMF